MHTLKSIIQDDWSYLEKEIDKGINSGISKKSHTDIINNIKIKFNFISKTNKNKLLKWKINEI